MTVVLLLDVYTELVIDVFCIFNSTVIDWTWYIYIFLIHEPAMYTIQHYPARLYNCDKTAITIVQHKHTKILGLKGKRQISSVQSANRGISCDSRHLFWVQLDTSFLRYWHFQENIWNKTDEWHTAWINPRVQSVGVDTERDFHPVASSFHQTYRADKIRSLYLSTGRAPFKHK